MRAMSKEGGVWLREIERECVTLWGLHPARGCAILQDSLFKEEERETKKPKRGHSGTKEKNQIGTRPL